MKGGGIYFRASFLQFIPLSQSCFFNYSIPLYPSLDYLLRLRRRLTKSTDWWLQPVGRSFSDSLAWWANILSLIYFLVSPIYGLEPIIISYMITPRAKKSASYEWFILQITSGAMYPGVPLVSSELLSFFFLATPKSVILKYPFSSKTRFSGLRSLWMIPLVWMYSRPKMMHPATNSI